MRLSRLVLLGASHVVAGALGFAVGIYALPILIAPPGPDAAELAAVAAEATYNSRFVRELADSDALHWGEGEVVISGDAIAFRGELAPGPDYQLYLSPQFVETEADFAALKTQMRHVGPVKTFENFSLALPADVQLKDYNTVIVWCETFGQFITAGQYR